MKQNTISIIIPCYNEGEALILAVNSIMNQSVLPAEIIIIDDASTNPITFEVLGELQKKELVQVIYSKQNTGPGIARNIGIEKAKGEWIVLLDSDDIFLENVFENLDKAINQYSNSDFFFWNYKLNHVSKNEEEIVSTKVVCMDFSNQLDPYKLARNFIIPGCSPFRKSMWQKNDGYDPKLSKGGVEDIDFWRRAIFNGAIGFHIDETLYQWNRQETGNNSNIDEEKYLIHRLKMLSYYDKYNPEQAKEVRPYIYRYYSSRLMARELNDFLSREKHYFSIWERLKAKGLYFKVFYKFCRVVKNWFYSK
jgi:glycosyltransferase involved in cell wall biosynthesis